MADDALINQQVACIIRTLISSNAFKKIYQGSSVPVSEIKLPSLEKAPSVNSVTILYQEIFDRAIDRFD